MNSTTMTSDAARLIQFGTRQRLTPARDHTYRELVERAITDDQFAAQVQAVARGFDLVILKLDKLTGIVLAPTAESVFSVRMSDYAKRTNLEGKAHERVLHGLAHLGVAALAFPRPADLADPTHLGRITVRGVEAFVREATNRLDATSHADPPADQPGLELAWQVYKRRSQTGATGDGRTLASSTTGMVNKAVTFLADQGNLVNVSTDNGGTYRTTPRYRAQVLEASVQMFDDPLRLGIAEISTGEGSIQISWSEESIENLHGAPHV